MAEKDRRDIDSGRWEKLTEQLTEQTVQMTKQTVHAKYTADRLTNIEDSLGGTNVLELRQTVSDHTATINKAKGIAKGVSGITAIGLAILAFIKGLPLIRGLFHG